MPTILYGGDPSTSKCVRAILLTLFFSGIVLVLWGLYVFGWMKTWAFLRVPALCPPFADLRSVQAALRAIAKGFDPRLINPDDPWSRPMNYPIIWVKIARVFGLASETNYLLFVSSFVIAYLICVYDLLRKFPSIWLLAAIFSGSSLLAIERGNSDLLVFVLLYLSSMVPVLWMSAAMIMLGTILKIYPVFAAISLLRNRIVFGGLLLTAVVYFLFDFDDLLKVRSATPISAWLSYGIPTIAARYPTRIVSPILLGALLLMFVGALSFSKLFRDNSAADGAPKEAVRLFLAGSGVYVATFLLSSNWDYRLICIMLCIPYLLHLRSKWLKNVLLAQVLLASNFEFLISRRLLGVRWGWLVNSASKTALFVLLCTFLIRELLSSFPNLKWQNAVAVPQQQTLIAADCIPHQRDLL